jgi:hypothetical protein
MITEIISVLKFITDPQTRLVVGEIIQRAAGRDPAWHARIKSEKASLKGNEEHRASAFVDSIRLLVVLTVGRPGFHSVCCSAALALGSEG